MAESGNSTLNEFCAAVTGAAESRRHGIRFKGLTSFTEPAPRVSPDGDKIATDGIQTSSDTKYFARSAKIPELSNKDRLSSSNSLMSFEQEIKYGRGSMKLLSGSVKQEQFKGDTLCRFMRCDVAIEKRSRSQSSLRLPTSSQLRRSKRSKKSSPERRPLSSYDLAGANLDGNQCLKPTLIVCKSLKHDKMANNGIWTSGDAKHFTKSVKIPELSNKDRLSSSNSLMSFEQEIEHGRGSMKLLSGSVKQDQFKGDTLCRFIRRDAATKKSSRSQTFLGLSTSSQLRRSKRSSLERRPLSIDDLPDVVLVEILCRLPSNKFVFQCKVVSKRWCTIISDPYFIGRFVQIQSYKKIPKIGTLINRESQEFPPKISSQSKLLAPLFKGIMSFHRLIKEPVVVATYNDLVLCCASWHYQRDYYICNAYTMQWFALPPIPGQCHKNVRVGLICDIPYYNCMKDDWKGHSIQLNAECRCKVVRLLPPDGFREEIYNPNDLKCDFLNVEIFSSETGEWRELAVPSPSVFDFGDLDDFCFAYNGMLYWPGGDIFLTGLGSFSNDNSTNSTSSNGDGIIDHKLRFTVYEQPPDKDSVMSFLGVSGGCIRMCDIDLITKTFYVWELKEQDHDKMIDGAAGKLYVSKRRVYRLDRRMYPGYPMVFMPFFDPNDEDIVYLRMDASIIKCNIRTREWSKIIEKCPVQKLQYLPVERPWWPTPVPRLSQQHGRHELAHSGGTSRQ